MSTKTIRFGTEKFAITGDLRESYFDNFFLTGKYSDDITAFLSSAVAPDAVVIDVGANIGLTAIMCAVLAPQGRVYALEPGPATFSYLLKNIASVRKSNIIACQVAASDHVGEVLFTTIPRGSSADHIVMDTGDKGSAVVDVPCTTLDRFVSEHAIRGIQLIKIDVEGHELEVLKGAVRTIREQNPMLLVEFNSWTQEMFGSESPWRFLKWLLAQFPYIFSVAHNGVLHKIDSENAHDFLWANWHHGFVDNLLILNSIGVREERLLKRLSGLPKDGQGVKL